MLFTFSTPQMIRLYIPVFRPSKKTPFADIVVPFRSTGDFDKGTDGGHSRR